MTNKITPGIVVQSVTKRYGGSKAVPPALTDVSLSADEGEVVGLLGVNGAGKSTLVRILSTLLEPDSGEVLVGGFDALREPELARASIGVAQQDVGLDETRTVTGLLGLHARLHGLDRREARDRIGELLRTLRVETVAKRRIHDLSGGMRRKVDLALALVHSPPIVFLDEPTVGLDPPSRIELWDEIRRLRAGGTTVLLTTQNLEEADALADRIVILAAGRVIDEGTPAELKRTVAETVLELEFEDETELARGLACLGGEANAVDRRSLRLPVLGPDQVRACLEELHAGDVHPVSVRTGEPSLEDLFLRVDGTVRGAR